MSTFVLRMDSTDATLDKVGGKGTNLSRMSRADFPVPPGFLVTTEAYRYLVQANNLQKQIVDMASNQADTSEARSTAIRRLFANGSTIPADLEEAINHAYADLIQTAGELPLAVRSSATAEDLPGASFAGQQESYLNVHGEAALLDAVKRCWSSLWTPRALDYRARQNIDPSSVSLAVVVQTMVPAEAAGIMFTANPISGARDEIALDAAWGLGEAIVGGLVTPDHVVVDKATGNIKQMTVADKTVMTQPTATGTEERPVEENKRHVQVLTVTQATELAKLGAEIEKHYGEPQDIEWCWAKGQFYVVQARPITTLPPEPVKWDSPLAGAKWLKDLQAGEWATEPLSPLGATTTYDAMITARQRKFRLQQYPWHALINGWLYIRADYSVPLIPIVVEFIVRYLRCMHNGRRRVLRVWAGQIAMLDSLEHVELVKLSDNELQTHAERLLGVLGWWWWEVSLYAAVALFGEQFIGKLKIRDLADPAVLFRGNDSLLFESERALRQSAHTGEVETYLARFGHFVESADPIHPTLRESPDLLHQYLAVARQSTMSPDERLLRTRRERTEAENLVRAVPGLRGVLAYWMLNAAQSHAAHTDDAVFHFQRVLALVRATFLEVGRRMTSKGALEKAEDIFYLEYRELRKERSDLAELVTKRRSLRESQKRLAPPPYIPPLSDPAWGSDRSWKLFSSSLGDTVLERGTQERNGKKIIVGTPGSPGRARGIARVIAGPDDFYRFQPGDVLVAHTTTPVWTPLFNIASAAVTEVGGPFSHAAIVAREFGIPLVNGALDAVREIPDGTPVVVDSSAGIVYLEDYSQKEGQAHPEPVKWESPKEGAKWLKDIQAAEWATEPLSPLGATTTFATMIDARQREFPMQKSPSYALINGWLYIRADFRMLRMMAFLMDWGVRLVAGRLDGHQRVRRNWPSQLALLDSLEKTGPAKLSDDALQAHADQLLEALGWWWWEVSYNTSVLVHGEMLIGMLRVPELADPGVLFRGNDSLLLESERALRQAANTGELKAYLARFGHFVESADPIYPTLREAPDLLNQHLAVARQSKISPDERLLRTRHERAGAENLVHALRGPRGFLARRLLSTGQSHAAHVDDSVFHFQRVLALVRATFLEAGQRLARMGRVERAEDVFYMERGEVWVPPADLAERVTQRRLLRERHERLAPPPSIPSLSDRLWSNDPMMKPTCSAGVHERNGKRVLLGNPGSPGRARGTARVITGPEDFGRFQPGDVLVAHTTTPVWTPLFNIASAAVTEVGGPFSHAAIVAREFGIPLVTGAIDATHVIADGMPVVVDGSAGMVEL